MTTHQMPVVSITWIGGSNPQCPESRTPGEIICGTTANDTHPVYRVGPDGLSVGLIGRSRDRVRVLGIETWRDRQIDPGTAPLATAAAGSNTQPDDRE